MGKSVVTKRLACRRWVLFGALLSVLVLVGSLGVWWVVGDSGADESASVDANGVNDANGTVPTDCVRRRERREVRGDSMIGLLKPGQTVEIFHGYYDCAPVERGDIVVFVYSGNLGDDLYWIKTAQGLPGDRIGLGPEVQAERLLLVDDRPVLNPKGEPYRVNSVGASYIRLAMDLQMRKGVIPRGRYLMLGAAAVGGWDSRRVGLIAHETLIGKAVVVE